RRIAQRTAHRIHHDAVGPPGDRHDGPHRRKRPAHHPGRQQHVSQLAAHSGPLRTRDRLRRRTRAMTRFARISLAVLALAAATACGGNKQPVAIAPPPGVAPGAFPSGDSTGSSTATRPPDPPPIPLDSAVSSSPLDAAWADRSIDEINSSADAPLKPVFYAYDSD